MRCKEFPCIVGLERIGESYGVGISGSLRFSTTSVPQLRIFGFPARTRRTACWGLEWIGGVTASGKRIDDVYPIAQPIPMVIGAYRLLYLLVSDLYIITIDIDHHSPFLALDVMDKVKDVVSKSMDGRISFSEVEKKKIYYYYAFRRCINGIEGASVIGVALRKIRLADDPLTVYTAQNELININDCLHAGEIPNEVRNGRRDAWEAVIQVSV